MKKNIGTQEAHIRTIAGVVVLLLALFVIDSTVGKIFFAVLAAVLTGTAFLHSCPLYILMGKSTLEHNSETSNPEAGTAPISEEPVIGMEEESASNSIEEVPEGRKV